MLIFEIILAIFLFIEGVMMLLKSTSADSEIFKILYLIFAVMFYIAFIIMTSHITIWECLVRIKKQIKLRFSQNEMREIVSQEVKRQIPDIDKIFKFFGWFITVAIFLLTLALTIILKSIPSVIK